MFIVKDWADNHLDFYGESETFEDAWEKIYLQFPDEEDLGDYYVEEVKNE